MVSTDNLPPASLGLGGDGDEVAAIEEIERRFGVQLDYANARHWRTAGDVFIALQRALGSERAEASDTWLLFARAISAETGVDPERVTPQTLLLAQARFDWRVAAAVSGLVGIGLAVAHVW